MAAQYHPMLRGFFMQPEEQQKRSVAVEEVLRAGCLNCELDMKRLPYQVRRLGRSVLELPQTPISSAYACCLMGVKISWRALQDSDGTPLWPGCREWRPCVTLR